jgi:hypothetical protein
MKHNQYNAFDKKRMVRVFFCNHVKCIQRICFCIEIKVKTDENNSKTVHFMSEVLSMCILIYMWNVPKVLVSTVKTQWKHMKALTNSKFDVYAGILVKHNNILYFYCKNT